MISLYFLLDFCAIFFSLKFCVVLYIMYFTVASVSFWSWINYRVLFTKSDLQAYYHFFFLMMYSTWQKWFRITLYKLWAVRTRMYSTNEDVQYESRTPSVRARHIFSTSEDVQYESRTPSVQARHIISTSEDVQCEQVTSSVQERVCSTNHAHHQFGQGISLVQARMCIASKSHLQYKRGCKVQARMWSTTESTSKVDHQFCWEC